MNHESSPRTPFRSVFTPRTFFVAICFALLFFILGWGIHDTNVEVQAPVPTPVPTPPWVANWLPPNNGDVQCVYTNVTFLSGSEPPTLLLVWGRTVDNATCATTTLLRYFEQFVCGDWCKDHYHEEFPYDKPFNCSVTRDCVEFRPFFIEQPPEPPTAAPSHKSAWALLLALECVVLVVALLIATCYAISLYRRYHHEELLRVLPRKTNSFDQF